MDSVHFVDHAYLADFAVTVNELVVSRTHLLWYPADEEHKPLLIQGTQNSPGSFGWHIGQLAQQVPHQPVPHRPVHQRPCDQHSLRQLFTSTLSTGSSRSTG